MRTITVKGVGSVFAKPDYITITLSIDAKNKDYDQSMTEAAERIESLQRAVCGVGFEKGDLKTTDFHVNASYENKMDRQGSYERVFTGYVCSYRLRLAFDFDAKRLAGTISAISDSKANPELSIAFTVKNPAAVHEELLASAAKNAKAKAEILCRASEVTLGELVTIDYNWNNLNLVSPTNYALADECLPLMARSKCSAPEIEPDEIKVQDTAVFSWEIK